MSDLDSLWLKNAEAMEKLALTLRGIAAEEWNANRRDKLLDNADWYEATAVMYRERAANHDTLKQQLTASLAQEAPNGD